MVPTPAGSLPRLQSSHRCTFPTKGVRQFLHNSVFLELVISIGFSLIGLNAVML